MFNGIIEVVGQIKSWKQGKLVLDIGKLAPRIKNGDSIAVDGICLTVVNKKGRDISLDVSEETRRRTNLDRRKAGDRVNLELPLRGDSFVSGHFLQGHVEGLAKVGEWHRSENDVRLRLRLPGDLVSYCVPKGSIAVNGVSLTIASLRGKLVEIALIPFTLEHTNLDELQAGDVANIETDIIGRYVVSVVQKTYHKL
jgi:riboflavin synthase